jgi:hypothetical protein
MTGQAIRAGWEVPLRACCGKLWWALLEAIDGVPAGAHVSALRWGTAEIPLDVWVGDVSAARAAEVILDAAKRSLGPSAPCYAGRGALVINVGRPG